MTRSPITRERMLGEASSELGRVNRRLEDLSNVLSLVRVTVGELGKLNELSRGSKYYVRIATDTRRERLQPFLVRIENKFPGAIAGGMAMIKDPRRGSRNCELVFVSGARLA